MSETQSTFDAVEVGKRLQTQRKLAGETQAAVAERLGVSRPSVVALEAGQRRLAPRLLSDLAQAYGMRLSDLVRAPCPRVTLRAQFRLPADMPREREELERAVLRLELLASRYLEVERLVASPLRVSPVPRYHYEARRLDQDIEGIADAERRRLSIGDGPALKLRELLEHEAGLRVFHVPLPSAVVGLYGFTDEAGPCVAINVRHPHVRQRWTLAHEFGHYLTRLDRPETTRTTYARLPEQERFADGFASAFLMPRSGLERRVRELEREERRLTVADMVMLAEEYEVSLHALVLRLEVLRLVAPGAWDTLSHSGVNFKAASEALGVRSTPADANTFPRRFVFLVLAAYAEGLLTERELANLLDVDRLEARKVIAALTSGNEIGGSADWEISLSESTPVGS